MVPPPGQSGIDRHAQAQSSHQLLQLLHDRGVPLLGKDPTGIRQRPLDGGLQGGASPQAPGNGGEGFLELDLHQLPALLMALDQPVVRPQEPQAAQGQGVFIGGADHGVETHHVGLEVFELAHNAPGVETHHHPHRMALRLENAREGHQAQVVIQIPLNKGETHQHKNITGCESPGL